MFLGHFAVGLGAKAATPRPSLGTLFLASQFVDLLWPALLLLGIERAEIEPGITTVTPLNFVSYPITHSLLMVCVWGLLFGGVYWMIRKDVRSAVVLGLCVVSHWVLDLVVHRPDLPLVPGGAEKAGFGLWNSLGGTLLVEGLLFAVGVWLYVRVTRSENRVGRYALWALVAFLVVVYTMNVFGPPPPDMTTVAWVGQSMWLLVAWGYWIDRNRQPATAPRP